MPVKTNLNKLSRLRISVDNGEMKRRTSMEMARQGLRFIRQNWSGFAPPHSEEGDPPAILSGDLDATMEIRELRAGEVAVVANTEYAHMLEYGTVNMAPRPFLSKALKHIESLAPRIGSDILVSVLKRWLT